MEPMTLGSPVGSPGSPATSPFLPAFLMGEPATTPGSISMTKNPPLTGKQLSFGASPTLHGTTSPTVEMRARASASVLHAAEKGSGPPTRGLFDTEEIFLPAGQSPMPSNLCPRLDTSGVLDTTPAPTFSASTPAYSDGYWVTVFGFPSSAASHVLSQFSQYGTILASRSSPRGNWLHIKYQSSIEARKALSNNGKVFGGSFMVAVMPCKDPDVLTEAVDKEGQSMDVFSPSSVYQRTPTSSFRGADLSTLSRTPTTFPVPHRVVSREKPVPSRFRSLAEDEEEAARELRQAQARHGAWREEGAPCSGQRTVRASSFRSPTSPRQTTARPLTQAYRAAQHPSEVVCTHSMPQRSSSFVGKAMEYFFGW